MNPLLPLLKISLSFLLLFVYSISYSLDPSLDFHNPESADTHHSTLTNADALVMDNVALNKPATQSSTFGGGVAERAVDGNTNGVFNERSVTHTNNGDSWWRVDLQDEYFIGEITIHNRTDCCADRLAGATVYVGNIDSTNPSNYTQIGTLNADASISFANVAMQGRYVMIRQNGFLSLSEVEVQGTIDPNQVNHIARGKPATQSSTFSGGVAGRAVDGNIDGVYNNGSVTHTNRENSWWRVDLEAQYDISDITIHNRADCCQGRLEGAQLYVGNVDSTNPSDYTLIGTLTAAQMNDFPQLNQTGRFVMIRQTNEFLSLAEVEVQGTFSDCGDCGMAQCVEDTDYWSESWVSCTTTPSPNPARGDSHWFMVEFDNPVFIDGTHIWNANLSGQSSRGANQVYIDVFRNGTWSQIGNGPFTWGQAPESASYLGFEGPALDEHGEITKVVFTVASTHGNSCASIAEIRFDVDADRCVGQLDECGVCEGQGEFTFYLDADGDGLGNPNHTLKACSGPIPGYVTNSDDQCDTGGWEQIGALFADNGCTGCHNQGALGGLNLLSYDGFAAGGNKCGTDISTGSTLINVITQTGYAGCSDVINGLSMNDRVGGAVDDLELALIQAWVDAGAPEDACDESQAFISFINISDGQQFARGTDLYANVQVQDSDGIANVQLFINDVLVRVENSAPYEWGAANQNDPLLNNLDEGLFELTVVVTDANGATTTESIHIEVVSQPVFSCPKIALNRPIESYAGGQDQGEAEVLFNRSTIKVENNAWKYMEYDYIVEASTVMTFEFRSDRQGELHAIGIGNGDTTDGDQLLTVYGTDFSSGDNQYGPYTGNGEWESFSIPIGQVFSGEMNKLLFLADHDNGTLDGNSFFRNIEIYDDTNGNGFNDACPENNIIEDCQAVELNTTIDSYAGGQDQGDAELRENGTVLHLYNNAWKSVSHNYSVGEDTYMTFEFRTDKLGEVHAIGMDDDASITAERFFAFYGTETANQINQIGPYTGNGEWQSFSIHVGQFFTGDMDRITFLADHDNGAQDGESNFRNVKVFDDTNGNGQGDACDNVDILMCPRVVFDAPILPLAGQDNGDFELRNDKTELIVRNNGWKTMAYSHSVIPSTVLNFEFRSTIEGESHQIGYGDRSGVFYTIFLYGTDENNTLYNGSGDWQKFSIRIGEQRNGIGDRFRFVADHDNGARNGDSWFRNIEIFDDVNGNGVNDECPIYNNDCPINIIVDDNSLIRADREAGIQIQTNGEVPVGFNIDYTAGDQINLAGGFEVQQGAIFHAYIDDCSVEEPPFVQDTAGPLYNDFYGVGHTSGMTITASSSETGADESFVLTGPNDELDLVEASRFLAQTSLGASYEDIQYAQSIGAEAWIDEQMTIAPASFAESVESIFVDELDPILTSQGPRLWLTAFAFYEMAFKNEDALRQRMGFAWSQVMPANFFLQRLDYAVAFGQYFDFLYQGAFGNFRDMLHNITYSLVMSEYLTYFRNTKLNPTTGRLPDENYAREIMQLFSIGVYELNLDGSIRLDANGLPIETYDIDDIAELAKVFTGLHVSETAGGNPNDNFQIGFGAQGRTAPLKMFDAYHSQGEKRFINKVIPAGQTGAQDIDDAIDYLFNHPNVGPYMARLMIQHTVKSNPSPAYIKRVASVFNDNGQGVRGDLAAFTKAIFMDPEARECGYINDPHNGKLIQPVERFTHLWKAFDISTPSNRFYHLDSHGSVDLLQAYADSPSVFSFFSPFYADDRYIAPEGLVSPEFEILNSVSSIRYLNTLENSLKSHPFNNYTGAGARLAINSADRPSLDFSDEINIYSSQGIDGLLDRLNLILCRGQLTNPTRSVIKSSINNMEANVSGFTAEDAVHNAIYLLMSSSDYMIQL